MNIVPVRVPQCLWNDPARFQRIKLSIESHRYMNEKRRKLHLAPGTIPNSRLADSSAHLLAHGPFLTVGPVPSTIRRIVVPRTAKITKIAANSVSFASLLVFHCGISRYSNRHCGHCPFKTHVFTRRNRSVVGEGSTSSFADALEFNTDWEGNCPQNESFPDSDRTKPLTFVNKDYSWRWASCFFF